MNRRGSAANRPLAVAMCLTGVLATTHGALAPSATASVTDPPTGPIPLPRWMSWDGALRTRASLFYNLDLDRGPTPSTGQPIHPLPISGGQWIATADMRARLDFGLHVEDVVAARFRVDALDGLLLGGTPEGFPGTRIAPVPWAANRQVAPSSGWNAFADSIRLERAWAEVQTPFGLLAFGRMGVPSWGLGLLSGPPEDIDDDFDEAVDRIAFATSIAEHALAFAFDWNSIGPTSAHSRGTDGSLARPIDLEPLDNLHTVTMILGRLHDDAARRRRGRAGLPTISYGVIASYRWQRADLPAFYLGGLASEDGTWEAEDAVARRLRAIVADLWFRVDHGPVRAEIEAVLSHARVGDPSTSASVSLPEMQGTPWAVVGEVEVGRPEIPVALRLTGGVVSGDPAPGYGVAPPQGQVRARPGDLDGPQFDLGEDLRIDNLRLHPDFRVDRLFYHQVLGAVTDAAFVVPQVRLRLSERARLHVRGSLSRALYGSSTPSGETFVGAEIGASIQVQPVPAFVVRAEYALFLPGPALAAADGGAATPSQGAHVVLAVLLGPRRVVP